MHHALLYSCHTFNALPVKGLFLNRHVSTPFELFQGVKPKIGHLQVFGCPITARHWTTAENTNGKQTQRGIRGIFVGMADNQKGYLFYSPASRQLYISGDITFDETFSSTIATTWRPHRENLALRPVTSSIPDVSTTLEHTGDVTTTLPPDVEEGEINEEEDSQNNAKQINVDHDDTTADDDCPDLVPQHPNDDNSDASSDTSDFDSDDNDNDIDDDDILVLEQLAIPVDNVVSPQPVNLSRYGRVRRPNSCYAYKAHSYEWESNPEGRKHQDVARACAIKPTPNLPNDRDALSWEPQPPYEIL